MKAHPFDDFGKFLCDDKILKDRLPRPIYLRWKTSLTKEEPLDSETADAIAHVMKTWATELGATHYSHWFQPMTGNTAEKHDAFLEPDDHGQPMIRFSGKALIKGETDGSSFPTGGLRATFEARGYTYWDITSPVFIRDHVLCIPSVFVSYTGESLDKKAPLLKSIDALSNQATRVLNLIETPAVKRVTPVLGQEQEYFLVDEKLFKQRIDLLTTGRTLIGQAPPKGQDSEDHYFGSIPEKVTAFMQDVNRACWQLGIYSKVEHNEVAFNQFEIVPLYAPVQIAIDQNQLIMDILKKTARKHNLACLLHEKPFAGINGSGKHNNWSLVSDTGVNLFDPKDAPEENLRFLLFVIALIKAVDKHPVLLRMAASGAGNDHRLGANEAPPAIISIYLGQMLENIFEDIVLGKVSINGHSNLKHSPLSTLKEMPKEFSDRNRTSPFAFTGSKFEFRMVGASRSAATTNIVLNTALAESLKEIADILETLQPDQIKPTVLQIIKDWYQQHKRILYSGDGYSEYWVNEAKRRGLPNVASFSDSIDSLIDKDSIKMFESFGIYTERELVARSEILHDQFNKSIQFEAAALIDMINKQILPAASQFLKELSDHTVNSNFINETVSLLVSEIDETFKLTNELSQLLQQAHQMDNIRHKGTFLHQMIRPKMEEIRMHADLIESMMSKKLYPIPSYTDLLYTFD